MRACQQCNIHPDTASRRTSRPAVHARPTPKLKGHISCKVSCPYFRKMTNLLGYVRHRARMQSMNNLQGQRVLSITTVMQSKLWKTVVEMPHRSHSASSQELKLRLHDRSPTHTCETSPNFYFYALKKKCNRQKRQREEVAQDLKQRNTEIGCAQKQAQA